MVSHHRDIKKGSLIKNKYALAEVFGITTSEIEYHSPRNSGICTEYVWVLWATGKHWLVKVEVLEVVNESG
tara:strand:+ start:223 stop:435 length:213 start_codon:yes stop_codon:yes gene_type:complete